MFFQKKKESLLLRQMKSYKSRIAGCDQRLSAAQLTYKVSADKWSVQECVYHIAISEKNTMGHA
jgi:hypothetical protein